MAELEQLQQEIQHTFSDVALLQVAVTHPSVAHERGGSTQHNQRLEFLGDAVLQLILSQELYRRFPDAAEGDLTKARARLVNRRFLAEQGRRLRLGEYMILSRGEELHGGRERPSTVADAFEALLGALFLDAGFEPTAQFVLRHFSPTLAAWTVLDAADNPKGVLQELLQADASDPPTYQLECVSGPDHDRKFECAVYHRGAELGRGGGKSKKEAESQAALAAVMTLRRATGPGEPNAAPGAEGTDGVL